MKKISSNVIAIAIFIVLLCYSMDSPVASLLSIKLIGIMALGIAILLVPRFLQGMKKEDIAAAIGESGRTVGYIGTFVMLFFSLRNMQEMADLLPGVALSCRPILYGFIIHEVCGYQKKNEAANPQVKEQESFKSRLEAAGLTAREIQVALLINAGLSNKEIAEELYIAETTVKKHVANIFDKLGVDKRGQIK